MKVNEKENTSNEVVLQPEEKNIKEYWDPEINQILKAIKDNHWLVDWTNKEQRFYWKLLRDKIYKIEWFNWDFYNFIDFIIKKSDQYRIWKTVSSKKIYYNLAELMANIKAEHNKPLTEDEERKRKLAEIQEKKKNLFKSI